MFSLIFVFVSLIFSDVHETVALECEGLCHCDVDQHYDISSCFAEGKIEVFVRQLSIY